MVCQAYGAAVPAPDPSARPYGAPRKRAAESLAQAEMSGPLVRLAEGSLGGTVLGPRTWLTQVRLLVRGPTAAVARECFLMRPEGAIHPRWAHGIA